MRKIFILLVFLSIPLLAQDKKFFGDVETDSTLIFRTVRSSIYSLGVNAGSVTVNCNLASMFRDTVGITTDVNPTYTFTNLSDGQWITLETFSDGSNTINFVVSGSTIVWLGSIAPTDLTQEGTDIFQFYKSGSHVFGIAMQGFDGE